MEVSSNRESSSESGRGPGRIRERGVKNQKPLYSEMAAGIKSDAFGWFLYKFREVMSGW